MAKQHSKKRVNKMIGFRAYSDTDADLLTWWESIDPGARSDMLRELIRFALGYQPLREKPADILAEVRQEVGWIRAALVDLPGYVERVIHHVTANTSAHFESQPSPASQNGHAKRDADSDRRAQRMKKNRW
jgi:hypothetical protein